MNGLHLPLFVDAHTETFYVYFSYTKAKNHSQVHRYLKQTCISQRGIIITIGNDVVKTKNKTRSVHLYQ